MNIPAIAALNKEANVPAATDLIANLAITGRLLGAMFPKPPIKIPIDERFANPHNPNEKEN